MAFEMRDMTIALLPNKYHQKGDNKPCMLGDVKINHVQYEIALWAPKEGKKLYLGKVTLKQEEGQEQGQAPTSSAPPPAQNASTPPPVKPAASSLFR